MSKNSFEFSVYLILLFLFIGKENKNIINYDIQKYLLNKSHEHYDFKFNKTIQYIDCDDYEYNHVNLFETCNLITVKIKNNRQTFRLKLDNVEKLFLKPIDNIETFSFIYK